MASNDLLVSASDANALARLVTDARRVDRLEAEAAEALADALSDARTVPHERLPADRVAMNSVVAYREEGGVQRTVALVLPVDANPSEGRVSVLSPVGRALLGRRSGSTASICVPGGRALKIRVLEIERGGAS
ncbi:MAG: GreA/GreB family elongation factor [Betaproteobacteria bacterium]